MLPRMLTITLIFVMVLTFPLVSTGASARLEIAPKEYDFGEVQFGKQATATFTVRNAGSETLVIKSVRTSCGCTEAEVANREVPPNESTELSVRFDSSGLKGGKKVKTVFLESNNPGKRVTKLTIFATVVREVVVEPASLVTRLTGLKKTVEFSMKARNQSAKPVTLRLSSIQGSLTRAVMKPHEVTIAQGSESRFSVRMELTGKGNPHYFRGRLILETNHPGEKWIGLPYFIKVDSAR